MRNTLFRGRGERDSKHSQRFMLGLDDAGLLSWSGM